MKTYYLSRSLLFIFSMMFSFQINAQETKIMIRAKAKDAKFIGTSIGGAKVIVKDAITGELLDEGITSGSTGNTKLIMQEAKERYKSLSEESTAGYMAVLDIQEPKFITVEVLAPFTKKQALVKSSTQLWVIPGKDITGDGLILEIPGFVVDIISPQTHERIAADNQIELKANVVMMCGCPIEKDGLWDANQYEVKAVIKNSEGKSVSVVMEQREKPSTFYAETSLEKGLYEVTIYAYDPVSGNTGLDKTNIIVN